MSAGKPLAISELRSTRTSSVLEVAAEELPRSSTALPDLRVNPNASTVTFGRPSYTMPTTPSGTLI
ncbi:Uncharacterised protein [Mycobacteroides abscessus subsp. abscessus]|nr:Uncharacterised protein [Mycobacteroides abscessus subsp. abscessus]